MARAIGYKAAIKWIVDNDDIGSIEQGMNTVSGSLVADIYNKADAKVMEDILAEKKRQELAARTDIARRMVHNG